MSNNKNQAITYFNDAGKLYNIRLYDEALALYQKSIEADMTFSGGHFCIAKTLIRLKEYEKGVSHFIKFHHLIDEEKRGKFILALANILVEENQTKKGIELIEQIDLDINDYLVFDYTPFLILNDKLNKALHLILNITDEGYMTQEYPKFLKNKSIPESIIEKIESDKIVPRYIKSKRKFETLAQSGIQKEEYTSNVSKVSELLEGIVEKENCNYVEDLNTIESLIQDLQEIILQHGNATLTSVNTSSAKRLHTLLVSSKLDTQELKDFENTINAIDKEKKGKTLKSLGIGIISILLLCLIAYVSYYYYEKSKFYDIALNENSAYRYTQYLDKYGDDEKIHKLRENKMYEDAISSNNSEDINRLVSHYPNSKSLKKIVLNTNLNNSQLIIYGVGSILEPINNIKNSYFLIPQGAKIGYYLSADNKIQVDKFITITDDITINETFRDAKTLLFSDDFSSNVNGWTTFSDSKKIYSKTKNKGVRISNNSLQLYHEYNDGKFVLSTKYLSKLNKNINFEIIAAIDRKGSDDGTFLLFGGTKRAFNYIGFSGNGKYSYGYNNWDDKKDSWINLSNGWQRSNSIITNNYATNYLKITKIDQEISFEINSQYIGNMSLKRWYGNRIGFGINDDTSSEITNLEIYQLHNRIRAEFEKDKIYYCLVEELNVRDDSNTKGEILTTIKLCEPVKYLGEKGEKEINATFREIYSPDYYYKVELIDGTIGWVHGGALNNIPTSKNIPLENFKN